MRTVWGRFLMATALGLAVTSGLVRGDDRVVPVTPASGVVSEAMPGPNEGVVTEKPSLMERLKPVAVIQKVGTLLPPYCYAHFNDYSCGSLSSDINFMFGSCRTFYGERCLKGPPPYPVPGFDPVAAGIEEPGQSKHCRSCGW
jgi:hypothetical protein